jgi:hypothetical protein
MLARQVLYSLSHSSSPLALVILEIGLVFAQANLDPNPILHFPVAGMTGMCPHAQLFFCFLNFHS